MMSHKHRKTIYFPLFVAMVLLSITLILLINGISSFAIFIGFITILCLYLFFLQKRSFITVDAEHIRFRSLLKIVTIQWQWLRLVTIESYNYPEHLIPQAANYLKFKFIYNNGAIIEAGISGMLFPQTYCIEIEQELYQYCQLYNIKLRKKLYKYIGRNQFSFAREEFLVGRDE
ncbi:hypothetical protein ACP8Y2_17300 [Herpetosiphon llansteffanensis]